VSEGAAQKLPEATPHGVANATPHSASTQRFKDNAEAALADRDLQNALKFVEVNFIARRQEVADRLPEFEALRDAARDIKDHALAYLDLYLEAYERRVTERGGHVHYAVTAEDARNIILDICRRIGARAVTKGKSMVAEEIGLNDFLDANGIAAVETDLGEYIIQLRHEMPSHIIAPAVHLTRSRRRGGSCRRHRRLRIRDGTPARALRARSAAARRQHDHRPVALRRYRADPHSRRPRAAEIACDPDWRRRQPCNHMSVVPICER
jgi:L-lactate dehydrogenase complex protein LldF